MNEEGLLRPVCRRKRLQEKKNEEIGVLYGFRALMVLFVAGFHIYQQSWLRQSVQLFSLKLDWTSFTYSGFLFVDGLMLLSGFLLFLPYTRLAPGEKLPSCRSFYFRRFRRIVPSYELAVLLSFLIAAFGTHSYANASEAWKDLLSHVCFLQMFRTDTYLFSPINGAVWSIVVEMQFYLLFPLLAKWTVRKPALTLPGMALTAWAYRFCVGRFCTDTAALVNQMPAYLDMFALGMLGAILYVRFHKRIQALSKKRRLWIALPATLLFLAAAFGIYQLTLLQSSAASQGYEALRLSQMKLEFPFGLLILAAMLCAAFSVKPLQWLLSNRLMRFLSAISMNFYIWHQFLAVQLRQCFFPDMNALHQSLNSQQLYTLLCYLAAFVAAMALTYGWEQPCARLLNQLNERRMIHERSKNQQTQ